MQQCHATEQPLKNKSDATPDLLKHYSDSDGPRVHRRGRRHGRAESLGAASRQLRTPDLNGAEAVPALHVDRVRRELGQRCRVLVFRALLLLLCLL